MARLQKSKAMTQVMDALYKGDTLFHERLKVLENTSAVLARETISDLQALKSRINGHHEDLDVQTNQGLCKMTMTLNIHHLAIKICTKAFISYTKPLM